MSKLTAAIIEDEVPAARLLSSIITRLRPDWEVTVLPGSVEEAIVWFRTHSRIRIFCFWTFSYRTLILKFDFYLPHNLLH